MTECPSNYIGPELIQDIRIITGSDTHLPVAGGLMDQSVWWFELREALKREENKIEHDRAKRH